MSKKGSIKELELKRNNIITQLIRFNEFFTSFNVNTDSFTQLRARLDKCHDLYKEFDETQFHIQLIEPSLDDQERIKFEGLYFDAVARANSYLECTIQHNERGNNLAASSNDNPSHVAGSYDEYMSFYDSLNKALIHDNQTLTDIERFHYLRSCLKGDAAQLIACLETTAANYTAAWKLLVDSKGIINSPNITPGMMVIMVEDNLPPMLWSLGRIQEVYPGEDNIVRVVTVKTAKGVFKRTVKKICILPLDN
ncbi:hypothetical protein NQ317_005859 [Molorchus minor]|uniref:DUF5641 domain-containing protein n=1 Tax=Molorchus minor TaxID=1323400 RepID=A0ABQ9JAS1_9CUCU|nr:hypothetical protein NQ317_005859 [Molorchus minor]